MKSAMPDYTKPLEQCLPDNGPTGSILPRLATYPAELLHFRL